MSDLYMKYKQSRKNINKVERNRHQQQQQQQQQIQQKKTFFTVKFYKLLHKQKYPDLIKSV